MSPPKVLPCLLLLSSLSLLACNPTEAQQPTVAAKPSTSLPPDLSVALVAQIKNNAEQIGCKPDKCKILVTNFVFPGKGAPPFAVQLSDTLSSQLSRDPNSYSVADRARLQDILREERLAPESQELPDIAGWLGKKLSANAVLTAELSVVGSDSIQLSAHFFNTADSKKKGISIRDTFHINLSNVDLTPSGNGLPPFPETLAGQPLYKAGPAMMPQCYYMPNPPYTAEAHENNISGIVLFEAIVGVDGKLQNLRIVRGLPGGLNQKTLQTAATWRCKPAKWQGKPVPVVVPFEVKFQLY
jgi:TonB family protein